MELLEGGSLDDRLRGPQRIALDDVLSLGAQLIAAVTCVHAENLVHRDLKPANVLFATPGVVKVVDFGMARDLRASGTQTTGFAGATPLYCAPEQQSGGAIGGWTDVHALGLVLYDLATGRPPTVEPARRASAIRTARNRLSHGETVDALAHHAGDPRLFALLDTLAGMTAPEAEKRPRITDVKLPS
jgi:serine/threonine protein kinase